VPRLPILIVLVATCALSRRGAAQEAGPPPSAPPATSADPKPTTPPPGAPAAPGPSGETEAAPGPPDGAGPSAPVGAPSCLDQTIADELGQGYQRKGVQKRDFLKRHRFELSGVGGFYASDVLSSTYTYGGALAFYPSEDFGVEVMVTNSPVEFRLEEPFTQFDREHHFIPSDAWQVIGSLLWSPMHAKFKFTDRTIIHGDLFLLAGAGRTEHSSVQGLTWEVGGALKLYTTRFFTLRLDVRDFILAQEVLGRGRIANNVTTLLGVSLWLPG
jgi:outer membrane beta-barrel protein